MKNGVIFILTSVEKQIRQKQRNTSSAARGKSDIAQKRTQNEKCRQLFKQEFGTADYIGRYIYECHKAETTVKIKTFFQEYIEKKRNLDYYVMDEADGKITVVNVPFYNNEDEFAGVVEFIFESSLV